MDKTTIIKRYYKGRDLDDLDMTIVDKGDIVTIGDWEDETIEIDKKKVKVMITGSFIIDCYDIWFVDITKKNETIGMPLVVGISGYNKARSYVRKASKALGYKWLEEILIIEISITDRLETYYLSVKLDDLKPLNLKGEMHT